MLKRFVQTTRVWILVISGLLSSAAVADDRETLQELQRQLAAAATYVPGKDAAPLEAIEKIVFRVGPNSPIRGDVERQLIAALEQDPSDPAKAFLCEQLRVVGSEAAIPVLATQLTNPQVAFSARRALTRMDSPKVDEALLAVLPQVMGELKIGVIHSLGDRRYEAAVEMLEPLLNDKDLGVAAAAARALGRIGGDFADGALWLASKRTAIRGEVLNALLESAQRHTERGAQASAETTYRALTGRDFPAAVRLAGLRGLLQSSPADVSILIEMIRRGENASDAIALASQVQRDNPALTGGLVELLGKADPPQQVLLLRALGQRRDRSAGSAVEALTEASDATVRLAALESLAAVGGRSSVPLLLRESLQASDIGKVAREALDTLAVEVADRELLALSDDPEDGVAIAAIEAMARRRTVGAAELSLKIAGGPRPGVRPAAIAAVGKTGDAAQLQALLVLAIADLDPDSQTAAAAALKSGLARLLAEASGAERESQGGPFVQGLMAAPEASRANLLPLLVSLASPTALELAIRSCDAKLPALRAAGVHVVADWPTPEALPVLVDRLQNDRLDESDRATAIAGFVRLASARRDAAERFVQLIRGLKNVNEQKTVLAALGQSDADSTEALDAAMSFLTAPALEATCGLAGLRIANRLRQRDAARAKAALLKIVATVKNEDVRNRAQEVLNDMEKLDDHIVVWETVGPYSDADHASGRQMYATAWGPESEQAELEWRPISKGVDSWRVDLEQTFGALDYVAAYCRTSVWVPEATAAQLEMGADDAVRAWVNGKLVFDQYNEGGVTPRQFRAPIELKEGWNEIQLKVVDHAGGWGFCCRVRKSDGTKLESLRVQER